MSKHTMKRLLMKKSNALRNELAQNSRTRTMEATKQAVEEERANREFQKIWDANFLVPSLAKAVRLHEAIGMRSRQDMLVIIEYRYDAPTRRAVEVELKKLGFINPITEG